MLDPWALANSGWKKQLALRLFERAHLAEASCIHALNRSEADSIRAAGFSNPIVVIPNGIDLPDPSAAPLPLPWSPDGRKVLLFLGRIHPKKGLDPLLRAWAKLQGDTPEIARAWRLVIAGWDDGGHQARLEALAAGLGCLNTVSFPGPVFGPAKSAAYASADAFVLPSFSEGLPMTVLEAFAHGVPVFASTACNLPEGVESGAIVPVPTEPEGLASVLASVLVDPARLASMAASGRKLAAERFAWATIADRWREVYYWAAGRGPTPSSLSDA
jgi:poly(glycerol-phosphate) alpha-glucosyltransferase